MSRDGTGPRSMLRPLSDHHHGLPLSWLPGRRSRQSGPSTAGLPQAIDDALCRTAVPALWMGWRLRLLVGCALLGSLGLFALTRTLADQPHSGVAWRTSVQERIELASSEHAALAPFNGRVLISVSGGPASVVLTDALALQRSPRWIVDDTRRARHAALHEQLAAALAAPSLTLAFADGSSADVRPQRRGAAALPALYWLLAGFAFALFMVAAVVLLAQPGVASVLYAAMAWCQAGNLLLIAVDTTIDLGLPALWLRYEMPLRMVFDLVTAAALVHTVCLRPRRLPGAAAIASAGWAAAVVLIVLAGLGQRGAATGVWWWIQGGVGLLGLLVVGLLCWSYRIEPHPLAVVLRRFGVVSVSSWSLLTVVVAAAEHWPSMSHSIAAVGSMIWYVFLGSLLLLVPFLTKPERAMRELSLLAAISTVATSLDLLFVSVFSLGQFASLTLSLLVSLAVYSGVRQSILNQLHGSGMLTTERMFERLYQIAREVEARPERTAPLLAQLLRELFEPLESRLIDQRTQAAQVAGEGSSLLVPVPVLSGDVDPAHASTVLIRFAQQGQRFFTTEDARLTDRIVEQLRRAVAFDKAVEQGRREERLRLAQDLHDDIGARLLTLMYKAPSPEMEEYVRHTLQDLKTLTRGLAASSHCLSHSSAEWKADLTQRLAAAQIELHWLCSFDNDLELTVVHWSALTRVLRELVSNTLAHARACRVEIELVLEKDRLELNVSDNGFGTDPRGWSHGLGLGGIRKRVRQLGGTVEWRELVPHGTNCRVVIQGFAIKR